MPLTRYQIRNEYSLADPELYRAADKDDPEALLEGVAMAGLVGVLRQLGDLAEFAAEIFHDLHEEVMATAARGHGLMVRVQQLETDFPSIEKAFLSQTSQSLFFYNPGVDWHPNLHMDQNLVTQGDLPRFVMDSYEECRGPPRLFLLDKFDVAGAGACLKRYTDPSFFKVDSSSSGITKAEVHREKKTRKAKKKGSRWRNGETPEVLPTSHAKLHQLFLEESVENYVNDPARRVKLKRRLNGFPFDAKTGKSYMEKFLKNPTPDHNVVHGISVTSSPLKLPSNINGESGIEILEISTVNPKELPWRKRSPYSSPDVEETRQKPSIDELNEEFDYGISEVPKLNPISEADDVPCSFPKDVDEKEIVIEGESKIEDSADGYQSDDIASEVDNYMDALTTMDSEMETDTECRAKNDLRFLNIENKGTDADANEEQGGHQTHFSDSQSIGNSTGTDDENSSSRKGISSFSYSDSLSNSAENAPSDGDISTNILPTTGSCEAQIVNMSSPGRSVDGGSPSTQAGEHMVSNGFCTEEAAIPIYRSEYGEPSSGSRLSDSTPMLLPVDPGKSSMEGASVELEFDEISSDRNDLNTGYITPEENTTYLGRNLPWISKNSDGPSKTRCDFLPELSSENHSAYELDNEDPHVLSHTSLHLSNAWELAPSKKRSENSADDVVQAEYEEDECPKVSVDKQINSSHSVASHTQEKLIDSALPELETSLPEMNPDAIEADDGLPLSGEIAVSSDDVVQAEHEEEECPKVSVDNQFNSSHSVASPTQEKLIDSALTEMETSLPEMKPDGTEADRGHSVASHTQEKLIDSALPELETSLPEMNPDAIEADDGLPLYGEIAVISDDVVQAEHEEEECPKVSVDNQFNSSHSVASPTQEKLIDSALTEMETSLPEMKPDGTEADRGLPLSGEIAVSSIPIVDSPQATNFTEQQFPGISEDVPPLQLDSEEVGFPYSAERNLDKVSNASDGEELGGPSPDMDIIDKDAADLKYPSDIQNSPDHPLVPHVHLDDIDTETVHSEVVNLATDTHCDDNGDDEKSLPISPTKLQEESVSLLRDLPQNLMEIDAACSLEHLQESGTKKEADQEGVALSFLDSVLCSKVAGDDSHSEVLNIVPVSAMGALSANSLQIVDATTVSLSSDQHVQQSESKSVQHINVIENGEDAESSPTHYNTDPRPPLEQKVEVQDSQFHVGSPPDQDYQDSESKSKSSQHFIVVENAGDTVSSPTHDVAELKMPLEEKVEEDDQFEVESLHADRASPKPFSLMEPIQSPNHNDASSEFCVAHLPSEPSMLEMLPQLDVSEQANVPSSSILPSFGQLPGASQINLDEMPPLPPLPPMQWRIGKVQQSSLSSKRDLAGHNLDSIPPKFHSTADENTQLGHPAIIEEITQPSNPFLPLYTFKDESPQRVFENEAGYMVHSTPLSLQVPTLGKHENSEDGIPTSGRTQSTNPFLALPTMYSERTGHGFLASEGGTTQLSENAFSPPTNVEDAVSSYPSSSLPQELDHPLHQSAPERSSEDEKLQGTSAISEGNAICPPEHGFLAGEGGTAHPSISPVTNVEDKVSTYTLHQSAPGRSSEDEKLVGTSIVSEGSVMNPPDTTFPLPMVQDDQPHHVFPTSDGQTAWSSSTFVPLPPFEDGKPNGNRQTKLPRPRNPLIDAVVAHDKSKLRKATERIQPQIEPKADERDSLLAQIRTKSFNLKPAALTRPSIQGPKTNLKVAAILEKANAIRQALAGSDEDDDADSWSDS